ncbi:unnamed protein product [Amoebophrya sp. A25]|nr:unnamed protein product [Amoebophrya sp. A25]|eukprot:GSA25T00017037001.1
MNNSKPSNIQEKVVVGRREDLNSKPTTSTSIHKDDYMKESLAPPAAEPAEGNDPPPSTTEQRLKEARQALAEVSRKLEEARRGMDAQKEEKAKRNGMGDEFLSERARDEKNEQRWKSRSDAAKREATTDRRNDRRDAPATDRNDRRGERDRDATSGRHPNTVRYGYTGGRVSVAPASSRPSKDVAPSSARSHKPAADVGSRGPASRYSHVSSVRPQVPSRERGGGREERGERRASKERGRRPSKERRASKEREPRGDGRCMSTCPDPNRRGTNLVIKNSTTGTGGALAATTTNAARTASRHDESAKTAGAVDQANAKNNAAAANSSTMTSTFPIPPSTSSKTGPRHQLDDTRNVKQGEQAENRNRVDDSRDTSNFPFGATGKPSPGVNNTLTPASSPDQQVRKGPQVIHVASSKKTISKTTTSLPESPYKAFDPPKDITQTTSTTTGKMNPPPPRRKRGAAGGSASGNPNHVPLGSAGGLQQTAMTANDSSSFSTFPAGGTSKKNTPSASPAVVHNGSNSTFPTFSKTSSTGGVNDRAGAHQVDSAKRPSRPPPPGGAAAEQQAEVSSFSVGKLRGFLKCPTVLETEWKSKEARFHFLSEHHHDCRPCDIAPGDRVNVRSWRWNDRATEVEIVSWRLQRGFAQHKDAKVVGPGTGTGGVTSSTRSGGGAAVAVGGDRGGHSHTGGSHTKHDRRAGERGNHQHHTSDRDRGAATARRPPSPSARRGGERERERERDRDDRRGGRDDNRYDKNRSRRRGR